MLSQPPTLVPTTLNYMCTGIKFAIAISIASSNPPPIGVNHQNLRNLISYYGYIFQIPLIVII